MTALQKDKLNPAIYEILNMGWFITPILAPVELCQVDGQPKAPPWLAAKRQNFQNFWQLRKTCSYFLSKYWQKYKKIRVSYDGFFVLFTVWMCSDSIFNLLKRVTEGILWFLYKTFFLPFMNLGTQISVLSKLVYQPQISFRSALCPALFWGIA